MYAQAVQQSAGWLGPVQNALSWTMADALWIDICRVLVIFTAIGLMLLQIRLGWGKGRKVDYPLRQGLGSFMILNLLVMLQETQQIGERLVPWRLPLFAVVLGLAWRSAINRL